jgi:hypothetical protein
MTDHRDPNDPFYRKTADEAPQDKNNRWSVLPASYFWWSWLVWL